MSQIHTWSKFTTSAFKAGVIENHLNETVRYEKYNGDTGEGQVIMAREMTSTGDMAWKMVLSVSDLESCTVRDVFIPLRDVQQIEVGF